MWVLSLAAEVPVAKAGEVQVPVQGQRRAPALAAVCEMGSAGSHTATSPAVQQVTYLGDEQGPRSSASLSHICWGTRSAVFVFWFCCSAVQASPERRPRAGLGAGGHFLQPMAACLPAPATASLKSRLLHPSQGPRAGCTCDTASSQACSLFWVPGVCLNCVYGLSYKPDTWGETDWRERKHTERKAPVIPHSYLA